MGIRAEKWIVGAALAVAVAGAPAAAEATNTRIYTLGAMNRFIVDDANRWLYPHTITKYGSLFYLELFGSANSRNFAAPGSNRLAAQPAGLGAFDLQTYDIADAIPVQQNAGGGVILGITDDIYVSAHLSDYENQLVPQFLNWVAQSSSGDPTAYAWLPITPDTPASANRKFDLFMAYNMQDMAQFGLLFTFGSSKYIYNPNDNDPEVPADLVGGFESRKTDDIGVQEWGFLLSGGLEISEFAAVDAALGMRIHNLTYYPNQRDLIDGGGGLEFNADVRGMIGVSEQWEIVPALTFRYLGLSAADVADYGNGLLYNDEDGRREYNITDVSVSRLIFDLGVAGHYKPTDFISFWGAVGFHIVNHAAEYENTIAEDPPNGEIRQGGPAAQNLEFSRDSISTDALPYIRVALEARIFSWMDFRAGVIKYLRADTVKEDKIDDNDSNNNKLNDVTRDYPFFDYFVGCAVHYEGFFGDLQINPQWFLNGPEAISGASGSGAGVPMFANASLGYRF